MQFNAGSAQALARLDVPLPAMSGRAAGTGSDRRPPPSPDVMVTGEDVPPSGPPQSATFGPILPARAHARSFYNSSSGERDQTLAHAFARISLPRPIKIDDAERINSMWGGGQGRVGKTNFTTAQYWAYC